MVRKSLIRTLLLAFTLFLGCALDADPRKAWRNPKDAMTFVWIPAGSFEAQVSDDPDDPKKTSPKQVTFEEGFWMGRTEVTVGQFRRFVKQTGYVTDAEKDGNKFTWKDPGFKQTINHPVVYISYPDALSYCRWAGVDLPTETEWLYACRAGTTTRYYWGDKIDDRYLWHRANSPTGTKPVARKLPNTWGLYDMVGNAWEYAKVCDIIYAVRGGAWTRCPWAKLHWGPIANDLFSGAVSPRLTKCQPPNMFSPYPWDDDHGFRCIKPSHPNHDNP